MEESITQGIELSVHDSIHVMTSSEVTLTVYRSAEQLIELARSMIDSGEHSVATVVLHMACEIAVESCMSAGYAAAHVPHLEEPVGEFINGYSFLRKRNRRLYCVVTGDDIQNQPFWSDLLESTRRRNAVVHRGLQVSEDDSESSFAAVRSAVEHVSGIEKALRSP